MKERIQEIKDNMAVACKEANRDIDSVTLIAVSKTKPLEALQEAYDLGMRDFGENKVQEMVEKMEHMPSDARFHMIGHLQKNKVKYIAKDVFLIHGVDSYELALEIQKQAVKHNRVIPILIEVNIGEEESKFGVTVEQVLPLVEKVATLPNIKIEGLMAIPPHIDENCNNRIYFAKLRELSVDISRKNIDNVSMNVLSMGMSDDYPEAIKEGATYIRVGTAIFGSRSIKVEGER